MNIKEAKEEIKNAMRAYFTKDSFGEYRIPIEKQRPVFLMGPPGIGKTAIMEQIAQELNVGFISYSMTHHTRQSALGLPFIEKKSYCGKEYTVSEYTMSEIIASIYDLMEDTGKKEGILFLDEINCVSETLAPSMLQFLQYKVFGRHRVPEGWIVVTAGNPPEYNNSVREFDVVTWDRLKRINVEPDYSVWKEFAFRSGVHAAITTYLDIRKEDFYRIQTTIDGRRFVTARGWSDLSDMIRLYEENGIRVTERLISQYIQDPRIAKDFSVYYDLYCKYLSDYQVQDILDGTADKSIKERASLARFDERVSLLGMILDRITEMLKQIYLDEKVLESLTGTMKLLRGTMDSSENTPEAAILKELEAHRIALNADTKAGVLSKDRRYIANSTILQLEEMHTAAIKEKPQDAKAAFALLRGIYDRLSKELKEKAKAAGLKLSNLFKFCEEVFGEGQEMLIVVTELTISFYCAQFISKYGCPEYFHYNESLLFWERKQNILARVQEFIGS